MTISLTDNERRFELRRDLEPVARVAPGAILEIHSEDAFSGQIARSTDVRDRTTVPLGNPLVGPIWIEHAAPGDTLVIDVLDIEPLLGRCATYVPLNHELDSALGTPSDQRVRVPVIRDGFIHWNSDLKIPYAPMIGVVAVAPAVGVPMSSMAGDFGGNLDLPQLRPGASIALPVHVDGACLYIGDCHAAQGAAEITGAALEMAARIRLKVDVRRDRRVPGPRIWCDGIRYAVAVANNLERAVPTAFQRLAEWMAEDPGWDPWTAVSFLGQVGRLELGYYRYGIAAAGVDEAYLATVDGSAT